MKLLEATKAFAPAQTKVVCMVPGISTHPLLRTNTEYGVTEVPITWVRESHADVTVFLAGKELHRSGSYTDYRRFLAALDQGVARAAGTAAHFEATPASDAEVRLRVWLRDVPTLGFHKSSEYGPDSYVSLASVEDSVFLFEDGIDIADPWKTGHRLFEVEHSLTTVWSSRLGEAENADAVALFRAFADSAERSVGAEFSSRDVFD